MLLKFTSVLKYGKTNQWKPSKGWLIAMDQTYRWTSGQIKLIHANPETISGVQALFKPVDKSCSNPLKYSECFISASERNMVFPADSFRAELRKELILSIYNTNSVVSLTFLLIVKINSYKLWLLLDLLVGRSQCVWVNGLLDVLFSSTGSPQDCVLLLIYVTCTPVTAEVPI